MKRVELVANAQREDWESLKCDAMCVIGLLCVIVGVNRKPSDMTITTESIYT